MKTLNLSAALREWHHFAESILDAVDYDSEVKLYFGVEYTYLLEQSGEHFDIIVNLNDDDFEKVRRAIVSYHFGITNVGDAVEIWDTEKYFQCNECKCIFRIENSVETSDGLVCQICADNDYFYCDHCQTYHSLSEQTKVNTSDGEEYWCEHCVDNHARKCYYCGEYFDDSSDYIRYVGLVGDYVCDDCFDNNFSVCDNCGCYIYREDANWDDNGYAYCDECWNEREGSGHIRTYHDNPDKHIHYMDGEEPHRHLIGTEIETENGDIDERVKITNDYGEDELYIYQMHDGSLDSSGIECITQPMSKAFWDKFDFENWMTALIDVGARSHDTSRCGLHVHLSRTWMETDNDDEQLLLVGRMRQFLSDNIDKVTNFARREETRWSTYSKTFEKSEDKENLSKDEIKDKHKQSVKDHSDRYQSINNENRNTIEFRIFRGTLNTNTYRASVEFCLRVVDYVRTHEDEVISWDGFVTYKELPESMKIYMKRRNLLSE